jgi:hypothetical protein
MAALALVATPLFAQTAAQPQAAPAREKMVAKPVTADRIPATALTKATISGTMKLTGSHYTVQPGAGDACSNINVHVVEPPAPGGGLGATNKDLVPVVKATGDIKTLSCSYSVTNVPAGKLRMVSAVYDGPLAKKVNANGGDSGWFEVAGGQTYTKNFNLTFTIIQ